MPDGGSKRARVATISGSIPKPAVAQPSSPPASGLTLLNPRSISARATRAADASLGQVQ